MAKNGYGCSFRTKRILLLLRESSELKFQLTIRGQNQNYITRQRTCKTLLVAKYDVVHSVVIRDFIIMVGMGVGTKHSVEEVTDHPGLV